MNKFKSFVFGALFAVASVHTAFAAISQEDFDAIKKIAPEEYSDVFAALSLEQVNALMDADEVFKASIDQLVELTKQPKEPPPAKPTTGMDSKEPFTFDKAYAMYKIALDSNDTHYLIGYVEMDSLEKSATTPEQKEKFNDFKTKYEAIYEAALEKSNTNFADATRKLLTKAWVSSHSGNKNAAKIYVNEGISLYHRHIAGDKKGKATKVQLQDFYYNYRQIIMEKFYYGFDWIDYTPDGKKIKTHTTYNIVDHDVVRKDLGRPLGVIGSVSDIGKIQHEGVYIGQVSFDGFIYNAKGDEVGKVEDDGKIRIKGKVVAEYKNDGRIGDARKCFIGGKYVGSIKNYSFSYADNKQIELERATNGIFEAFVLFFYKLIPQ